MVLAGGVCDVGEVLELHHAQDCVGRGDIDHFKKKDKK
jgi:hypothetical protein